MKKYGKKILVLVAVLALIVAMGVPALGASAENKQTVATPVEADADGNHIISVAYDDGYATPPADESAETVGQPVEGAGKITIDLPEGDGAKGQAFTYKIYRVFKANVSSDGTASYNLVNGATDVPSGEFEGVHRTDDPADVTYRYKFVLENGNVKLQYFNTTDNKWLDVDDAHQPNNEDGMDNAKFNEALGSVIKTYIDANTAAIPSLMEITVTDTNGSKDKLEITNLPLGYYYITTGTGTMVTINTTNTTANVKDKNTIEKPDKEITSVTNGDVDRSDYSIYTDGNGHSHIGNAQIGDTVGFTGTVNVGQGAINYTYKDLMSKGLTFNQDSVTVDYKRSYNVTIGGTVRNVTETGKVDMTTGARSDVKATYNDGGSEVTTTPAAWTDVANCYTVAYQGSYSGTDPAPGDGATTFTVAFNNDFLKNFSADDDIYVRYSAVLNKNAKVGQEGNPNEAWLSYGNDPDGGHDTDTTETKTYTGKVTVTKTDGANPAHYIEGASFVLQNKTAKDGSEYTGAAGQETTDDTNKYYKWNETDGKVEWVDNESDATVFTSKLLWKDASGNIYYEKGTDADNREPVYLTDEHGNTVYDSENNPIQKGVVVATVKDANNNDVIIDSFKGLPVGHFLLHETVTPPGYNTAADEKLEIKKVTEYTGKNDPEHTEDTWDNTIELTRTVKNLKGFNFPSTGGIGTTILYVIGSILVIGACVLLISRKRMKAEK